LELPAGATYVSTSGVFLKHRETMTPEPGTLLMFVTGLMGLGGVGARGRAARCRRTAPKTLSPQRH
jgi:hypothetical protein